MSCANGDGETPGNARGVEVMGRRGPLDRLPALGPQAISSRRLDLLPLSVEYAEEMAAVLSDPALRTFTGGAPDTPRALRSRYQHDRGLSRSGDLLAEPGDPAP